MMYKYNGDYMVKRFKTKRKIKSDLIFKYILIIVFGFIIIKLCFLLILKLPTLDLVFNHKKISTCKRYLVNSTINNPKRLLNYYSNNNLIVDEPNVISASYIIKNKPLVYIYNTHQKEAYKNSKGVYDASFVMQEELKKYNIDVIVETRDITEFMRANNIDYSYSYYASKFYIKDTLEKNNIDLLIDLHRDSLDKKTSTITINKKNYAKILFVVGGENKNYKKNLELANTINNLVDVKYPDLSRGVIIKKGVGVNGVYNQDLSSKMILLELGGNNNSFEEVTNTISLIVPILGDYLYGKR